MTNEAKYKTPKERRAGFRKFCESHECARCPAYYGDICGCMFEWLTLEVKEEKLTPCPFCGGETHSNLGHLKAGVVHYWVDCISPDCMYRSAHYTDKNTAIAAHNRVASAVKAAKESEVADGK